MRRNRPVTGDPICRRPCRRPDGMGPRRTSLRVRLQMLRTAAHAAGRGCCHPGPLFPARAFLPAQYPVPPASDKPRRPPVICSTGALRPGSGPSTALSLGRQRASLWSDLGQFWVLLCCLFFYLFFLFLFIDARAPIWPQSGLIWGTFLFCYYCFQDNTGQHIPDFLIYFRHRERGGAQPPRGT